MNTIAANQGRTFLRLFAEIHPFIPQDRNLPQRIQQRLAKEKRFGSRDRRLYRELLYTAVRYLPWIEALLAASEEDALNAIVWLAADLPATRPLKQMLPAGWPPPPVSVAAKAAHLGATAPLLPLWFRAHCPAAFEPAELDVLHTRAPLWLRLQTDAPRPVFDEFTSLGWSWKPAAVLPGAIELSGDIDVTKTNAYRHGLVEVQDLGSQLLLEAAAPPPGSRWLDACAGAGGKTLQLARLVGPTGWVEASDPRAGALNELKQRVARAGLSQVTVLSAPPTAATPYDGVLVDAPCSGTGTWRRAPHLKWCTTEADVVAAAKLQGEILAHYARHVRPGGQLVYATCSLSRCENEDVAAAFLAAHRDFAPVPLAHRAIAGPAGCTLLPSRHNTDGFFVAIFRRAV